MNLHSQVWYMHIETVRIGLKREAEHKDTQKPWCNDGARSALTNSSTDAEALVVRKLADPQEIAQHEKFSPHCIEEPTVVL